MFLNKKLGKTNKTYFFCCSFAFTNQHFAQIEANFFGGICPAFRYSGRVWPVCGILNYLIPGSKHHFPYVELTKSTKWLALLICDLFAPCFLPHGNLVTFRLVTCHHKSLVWQVVITDECSSTTRKLEECHLSCIQGLAEIKCACDSILGVLKAMSRKWG